jgi:hypothetical protein
MRRVDEGARPVVAHLGVPMPAPLARWTHTSRGTAGGARFERWRARRAQSVVAARLVCVAVALAATVWPLLAPGEPATARGVAHEWPHEFEGRPLRPQALGAVEQRFADRFPGAIGRFDDGRRAIVLRHVTEPTRMLHPAADCFRGLGYAIRDERLEADARGTLQRCFVAEHDGSKLRVCERIVDADGAVYTDASWWYWAAALGRSTGPWLATTTAEPL